MQPVYTRVQLEALQVPVLELLTLHLAGQTYPLARIDVCQRPEVADLARVHRATGALTLTTQGIGGVSRVPGASCWLVVQVAQPPVAFALLFTLPSAWADMADVALSRTLTLLFDGCVDQAARTSVLVEERLWPMVARSLTLTLDVAVCDRLAQYLLCWSASPVEGEEPRWPAN